MSADIDTMEMQNAACTSCGGDLSAAGQALMEGILSGLETDNSLGQFTSMLAAQADRGAGFSR